MKQEFHLILGIDEFTDSISDALFEAGFDDAHLSKRDGRPCIIIDDRDISDLTAAVRSAVADAEGAGVKVARLQIPDVEQINAELATASPFDPVAKNQVASKEKAVTSYRTPKVQQPLPSRAEKL